MFQWVIKNTRLRPAIININSNEPLFYAYSNIVNKYSGTSKYINNSYAKWCIPDVFENINIKVFNLISRIIETRHISWYEPCTRKCRLDASLCNYKQCWNNDKLTKVDVLMDLFRILEYGNVNMINYVT